MEDLRKPFTEAQNKTRVVKDIKILYHANCDDGFASAWCCYRFFKGQGKLDRVDFYPVKYNESPPALNANDTVYIVDFSYPRDTLLSLKQIVNQLTVLDHHKTAEAALKGIPDCHFDMGRSGAMLTWNWFFKEPPPKLIQYVQDNDLWLHKMKHSKEVTRFIRSFPMDFDSWDMIYTELEFNMNRCLNEAIGMQRYFDAQVEFAAKHARSQFKFHGYQCPVANLLPIFTSEGCMRMMQEHDTLIAMSYFIDANLNVICSLRSSGEVDVGALAKQYGGGGHQAAAGFKMSPKQFFIMLYSGEAK